MKNSITVIGHVGKDPEARTLENGKKKVEFSVATTEKYVNKTTGEEVEETEWHRIECWSKLADIVESYVKKGMLLYVEGKQKHISYEKQGEKKTRSFLYAREVKILTPKSKNEQ